MKKACKRCKLFGEGTTCPQCGGQLTEAWKGRVIIINPEQSVIAKKLKLGKGTFAIKV